MKKLIQSWSNDSTEYFQIVHAALLERYLNEKILSNGNEFQVVDTKTLLIHERSNYAKW